MKSADVRAALRAKFGGSEWAIFFEVGDGTGMNQRRWADAVAMNLWPSRGMELHGFEIKVSRSDWLSELKNPAKSEPVQRYCDRWWIICPAGIIKPGELPPTWGHYEVSASGQITQVVAAPKLEPVPVNRSFMAAMFRRASGADADEVAAAVSKQVEAFRVDAEKRVQREIDVRSSRAKELIDKVNQLKELTGIDISRGWDPIEKYASAIKLVLSSGVTGTYGGIKGLAEQAERSAAELRKALAEFESTSDQSSDKADL